MPFDVWRSADATGLRGFDGLDWPDFGSFRAVAGGQDSTWFAMDAVESANPGSPEYATITVPGDVAGSTATTQVITIGDSVVSQIETSGDQDWFRVQLQAGVTYEFRLTGTGSDILDDPYLELMSASGTMLKDNDDGAGNFNSLLRYTPATSGTYYLNAHGWVDPDDGTTSTGTYTLSTTTAPTIPTWTIDQIAQYLVNGAASGLGARWQQTTLTYNIQDLSTAERGLAQRALDMWAAITPLNFVQTTGNADLTFVNAVVDDPGHDPEDAGTEAAYARTSSSGSAITSSTIVVTSDWSISAGGQAFDSYQQHTYIHEIGHALGLGHSGPYDGSAEYGTDNLYTNDHWAFTVMSYFDQLETGHGNYRYVLGPQQADIAAIQLLYGANPAGTFSGNTTFGFNSSAPGTNIDWSQFVLVDGVTYLRPPAMTIYDTGGVDTINLSGFAQPQILDLRPGTFSSLGDRPGQNPYHYVNVVAINLGTIIENAIGGSGNDRITGNNANNVITLRSGADTFVYAPDGGADTITDFSLAADKIDLTALSSTVAMAAFNGRTSSAGGTLLTFGSGQSILLQGINPAQLTQSSLIMNASPPPPPAPNTFIGTAAADSFAGTNVGETFYGEGGNDVIRANGGNDVAYGGTGNDTILGGDGNDTLYGDDGNDTLRGEAGNDSLFGGAGADLIVGADGVDRIEGDAGNDTLYGGDSGDTILGGVGDDRLYGDNGNDYLFGGDGADLLVGGAGNDRIYGEEGNDKVYAGAGDDIIIGGAGDDNLRGEAGEDVIYAGDGSDAVLAGADDDRMYGEDGSDRLYGEAGDDLMFGGADNDSLRGGAGNDTAYGGTGSDILIGDDGEDTLYGEDGPDKFFAGNGNDLLIGADGNDVLRGDAGIDVLDGGEGSDTFLGGTGADTFIIAAAGGLDLDRIKDFEQGLDVIRLVNSGFADFAAVQAAMAVIGVHTILTLGSGDRLIIDNVLPGDFLASDFELAAAAEPQAGAGPKLNGEPAGSLVEVNIGTQDADVSALAWSGPDQFDFAGLRLADQAWAGNGVDVFAEQHHASGPVSEWTGLAGQADFLDASDAFDFGFDGHDAWHVG